MSSTASLELRVRALEGRAADQDTATETLTEKVNDLLKGQAVTHKGLALLLGAQGLELPTLTEEEEDALFD